MLDVAIICSVIPQRHHLLARSIETWRESILHSGLDAVICVWSEGCPLYELVSTTPCLPDINVALDGQEEPSGSHIKGYNHWFETMQAKTYIFTHPDLLFPKDTVSTAFKNAIDDTYVAFKCFWLSPILTNDIDKLDWLHPETIEKNPLLYELDPFPQGNFYANAGVRQITLWESSTTYAINAQTAQRMYPMPDFGHQVSDDPYQAGARQRLGIKNHTVMEPILVHQWHPNSRTISGEQGVLEATEELKKRFG